MISSLGGGGEAGDLFRDQNWLETSLGHPAQWPQSLIALARVMLNSSQPMFIAWGPERTLLYNDSYSPMLGARHPQAFGRPFFDVWPEVSKEIGDLMDKVFAGEPVHMDDLELTLHRNGPPEKASFSFSYTPVSNEQGIVIGLFCACTETTGRITSEQQKAADAKRERDRLFEMSRDLFGVATFEGYLLSVNPAWSVQLDRSTEDLLSRPFSEIIHPDDLALTADVVSKLQSGQPVHQFHVRLMKSDGTPVAFAWSAVPEADAAKGIFYTVGRDITEELRREDSLRQRHKMEALGQLTGGLAHDFNNLLQAAQGCLELIHRKPHDSDRVSRLALNGIQATERGAKLTAQLLAFSRAQKFELRPIDSVSLIAGFTEILRTSVGPLIKVSIETGIEEIGVLADPTQLEMAIMNLAANAREAMPNGGELFIGVSSQWTAHDSILASGEYVRITVRDTGGGMAQEVQARAFEPFYTTKSLGEGAGLGLSQVYAMAKQAGGMARIEATSEKGTTILIELPLVKLPAITPVQQPPLNTSALGTARTVLVVDDDPDVRQFLVLSLETLGCKVFEADSAEHGLMLLDAAKPDLLLLDFAMPGMNGAQMAKVVRQRHHNLPIVFASGYSETAAIEEAVGEAAILLRKPFGVADLERMLSVSLGAPDATLG
jgi:PAS domain S-box-containing protein